MARKPAKRKNDGNVSQQVADGAQELLIALQTPLRHRQLGVPVLLWSEPGQGKTSFVESLARTDFPVLGLIASIHDPTDFGGLPIHIDGQVRMAPPEWALAFDRAKQGILLLDELTTAPPSVQAALLRVVLERRVGMKQLPPEVRIIAAANPPDQVTGGWELSPPLANRFVHLKWRLTAHNFAEALTSGFGVPSLPEIEPLRHAEAASIWKTLVGAYLRREPASLNTRPTEGEYAFASPRTWADFAVNLMASCEVLGKAPRPGGRAENAFFHLLVGSVGSGAAQGFVGFLKNLQLPDPEDVLRGKATVDIPTLKDDELHVLFASLSICLSHRRGAPAGDLLDAAIITLQLADQVSKCGKVDTVFAAIRQIAIGQTLQAAAEQAHQTGRLPEYQKQLQAVFSDTSLAKYIDILAKPEVLDDAANGD